MILADGQVPNPAQVSNDHFTVLGGGLVAVLVALCTLGGIVIPLLISTRRAASDQTANNHDSNLRDDLDDKHAEQGRKVDWLLVAVSYLIERDQHGDTDANRRRDIMRSVPDSGDDSRAPGLS